ncbi:hypothetical protein, partial [uncultured Demequina sp.]|uniref:hypothetical protein n=1 Tax=uncultured Demequina sp. TaxID=693499 RepID=UPI0025D525D8
ARRAASRSHAITLATEAGLVGAGPTQIPPAALDAAITATRARLVLQMALEHTGAVAAAVDAHDVLGGTRDERDAAAAQSLAASLPLWDEEREALVRRDRRRRVARTGVDFDSRLTSGEPDTDLPTDLAAAGMTAEEAAIARGRATTPPGAMPEDFEHPGGETEVWPPHPLQALACEPVTDDDYARRARAHSHVARAWAVGGRLAGVRWDGSEQTSAAPDALGAVTLVVERRARPDGLAATSWPTDRHFLREVLALAIGSEVHSPHPTWLDSYDPLDPRRLLCDEVGAAVLKRCAITLQGTLLAGPAVDQTALVAGVVSRLEAFFASGRPESRPAPLDAPAVDGPWPPHPQPLDGWIPGEPVRLTEVVQAIVADDAVLGVEGLALRAGTGPWVTEGAVELDPDCVPGDVDGECVRVRLVTTGECGHV